jgi:hypothetical protein
MGDRKEAGRISKMSNRGPRIPGYKPGAPRVVNVHPQIQVPRIGVRNSIRGVVPVVGRPVGLDPVKKVPVISRAPVEDRPGKVDIPHATYLESFLEDPDMIPPKYLQVHVTKLLKEANAIVLALSLARSSAQLPVLEGRLKAVKTSLYIIFNSKHTSPVVERAFRDAHFAFAIRTAIKELGSARQKLGQRPEN